MATKFDIFSKPPASLDAKVDPFSNKGTPLPEHLVADDPAQPKKLLIGQRVEATLQMRSVGKLYEVLDVNGDPAESRSLEISIKTQSWNGGVPAGYPAVPAGSYPFFENCALSSPIVAAGLAAAPSGFYAVIEFGTETKKKKITIDCSRGADVVVPATCAKISTFFMSPGAAVPFLVPANMQPIGWVNVAVSYAEGNANKHNPRVTIFPVATVNPAAAAGLVAGANVQISIPAYANRVKVYCKALNVGVIGTAGNYFVSQSNGTANDYINTVAQALLGNPDWIELVNDAHRLRITADLVDIHQVRAIFELDI
jgi:hypothetical protein